MMTNVTLAESSDGHTAVLLASGTRGEHKFAGESVKQLSAGQGAGRDQREGGAWQP